MYYVSSKSEIIRAFEALQDRMVMNLLGVIGVAYLPGTPRGRIPSEFQWVLIVWNAMGSSRVILQDPFGRGNASAYSMNDYGSCYEL
jgi:hypothetical protein